MKEHPLPWKIQYPAYAGWHEKASPRIVDADGLIICVILQHVAHPGLYDPVADQIANVIVSSVNLTSNVH